MTNPLENQERLITRSSLIADFEQIGLRAGQVVIVHASMKALNGWIVGSAPTVIDALMAVLTPDGTLVMPTHSSDNTDPAGWRAPPVPEAWWDTIRVEMPLYRPDITPTRRMGIIAETFRRYPGVIRSSHPAFSMAAWGREAAVIMADHPLNNDIGPDSPIGKVYDRDGFVMLLGVGHGNNTSLHMAEILADWPDKKPDMSRSVMLIDGERQWVSYRADSINSDDFPALGAAYEAATNAVTIGMVAGATTRFMRQRPLIDFAVSWMTANRPASLQRTSPPTPSP